jgi:CRISPR-associated protein Cmr2
MSYVMAIAIGPVQDFIVTARRSRDLWFGSWLLSELSKAAANAIVMLPSQKTLLIFPATIDAGDLVPDSAFNVVNKILAVVEDPKAAGKVAEGAVHARLKDITELALNRINDTNHYFGKNRETAFEQVDDMIEVYWAASPFNGALQYAKAREKAESFLIARKTTRSFSPAVKPSNAPKSALDGQRESVIDENAFDKLTARQLRQSYGVGSRERLCGVGLLKRNGNRGTDDSFFSTSHVASLPLLARLKTDEQRNLLENYIADLGAALQLPKESPELGRVPYEAPYQTHDIFSRMVQGRRIGYDGHLLFAERLGELIEDKKAAQKAQADLQKAQNALNDFLLNALDGEKPSPYYALLQADGDNMGDAIDKLEDLNSHRKFSERLSDFAKSVSKIVIEKYKGSLVYAGGDDVLAFLPLHTVIQCSRELADQFKNKLRDEKVIAFQPTLSVGVVIAHHMEPLQEALTLVRKAEKIAKTEGKNALAIILSKRSGFDTIIRGGWQPAAGEPLDYRLIRFAQLHMAGELPDGAAYELRELQLRLVCNKLEPQYDALEEAMRREAVRILGRKQIKDPRVLAELKKQIEKETKKEGISVNDQANAVASSEQLAVEGIPVGELANELIVARELARSFEQAEMKAEDLNSLLTPILSEEAA